MKKKLGFDLVMLGAPAAGKDTQAALLERKFALKAVESGKYLRSLTKNKTKIGELLHKNLSKGLPAPVNLVKEFLKANVSRVSKNYDLIFVGNPRLRPEAEYLNNLLTDAKRDYLVIYINLPVKEIWRRSEKRMRNIDDSKYVQTRINWHRTQVAKTVRYFQSKHKLRFIDGNRPIKEVNKEIIKVLNDYERSRRD